MPRRSWDDVNQIMHLRRQSDNTLIRQMQDVTARYEGATVIPLGDVEGEPTMHAPAPNLIADVIETTAMQCASTTPTISVPALDPTSSNSAKRASTRRRALYSAWDYSALLETILPRSYRHLVGYGTNSMMVLPDYKAGRARIEVRDPLTTYPEHRSPEDTREPENVGFIYGRSPQFLMSRFPQCIQHFTNIVTALQHRGSRNVERMVNDTLWDVVEWIDEDQIILGILGPREMTSMFSDLGDMVPGGVGHHLTTYDNRAGMVPVAIPRRVTLHQIEGQVTKLTGLVDMMGKLMALDVLAAEKAVFADMVVLDKDGVPQLLNASGKWNDGRTGEANLVKGSSVQLLQGAPGPLTHPVVDRLEGYFRQSGGLNQMSVGQNNNGLRTGNALEQLGAISINPRNQEAQRLMTRCLKVVNEAVCEVEKGYFPNKKAVYFSGWPGDRGMVTYTPAKDFDSRENAVQYAFPGTDINQLTVAIGQAVGAGLISKKTARSKHPLNENPEEDEKSIMSEALMDAAVSAVISQAQAGALPLEHLAMIDEEFEKSGSWRKAFVAAANKAREQQATPAAPTDPASMPGLAMPGQGAESMVDPAIPEPPQSTQNFRALMNALQSSPSAAPIPA